MSETAGLVGNDALPKSSFVQGFVKVTIECALLGAAAWFLESGPLDTHDAKEFKVFCMSMFAYLWVAYGFMFRQGAGKALINPPEVVASERKECKDHFASLDRTTGNMVEQMPCVLCVCVLYAFFVNPPRAGYLMFAY